MAKKKIDLKNFNIKMIEDMQACTVAQKILFKRFEGQTNVDISTRKNDFLNIVDEGRGDWILFFCLSIMPESQRCDLLRFLIDDIQQSFKGKVISQSCDEMFLYLEGKGNAQKLRNMCKKFSVEGKREMKGTFLEQCYYHICFALDNYIQATLGGKIPLIIKGSEAVISALILLVLSEDEFQDIHSYKKLKQKEYAMYAMKLTKVWPFE